MVKSKEWNWKIVAGERAKYWLEPSMEAYYLLERWASKEMKEFQ